MYITGNHLSRRTVLRGMGVSLALPFLDAMAPAMAATRRTAAAPRTRFAAIEMVHGSAGSTGDGTRLHYWSPKTVGKDFEMTPILRSLEPHRDYLTVVSHTDIAPATAQTEAEAGADHTRSSAAFLTCAHAKMTEGADIYNATSADQIYAQAFGQETPLPSLQLCIEDVGSLTGACGYGYSCVYANTISWSSPTTPLPMERDPRVAFERLFGDGATPEQREARRRANASILDSILDKIDDLEMGLGATDRARLDDYLEDVREIERRIQRVEATNASAVVRELPASPIGVPDSWTDHVNLMFDLQVLAFMTDTTRVAAFKMGRDVSSRVFTEAGIETPFHSLSHHGNRPDRLAEFAKLNAFHVDQVAHFIQRLKETPDGDGNLLDQSLVLYGSPMGDGSVHNHLRVPLFLAGHANGQFKGNHHLLCADGTPMANALLTVLRRLGVDADSIGDSTGELDL
ncbi:MAG: DUF1552 domain-containing protein [Acidobacteria bacterium]|nr:DUF1552 domain-containing protein [Acidobacteriota bacterium]MYJ02761.1 DUF1552 domain-containing protein [Acidobacteriota bacterium]